MTDTSGAVIPQVQVQVKNTATNAGYQTTTTQVGQYTIAALPPGPYQITFQADSFKKLVRSGIDLGVSQVLRIDASLELGAVSESVQVSEVISRVQTDSPEVGTTLPSPELSALPLTISDVRSPEAFAYKLSPGVSGSGWSSHINGSREASKELLLDGATVTTERAGSFSESSVSPESVTEFKVQTSGMSPEYGRTQGGVFNFVMRSGTNEIHGSGYGGVRREWMNANTFTNKFAGLPRSIDRKLDYAGGFGGPVYIPKVYDGRNRTFFYVTYERFKQRLTGVSAPTKTAPIPDFFEGDFSRLLGAALTTTDALGRQVLRGAIFDPTTFRQLDNGSWVGEMFPSNKIPVSRFSKVSQNVNKLAKPYAASITDASGQIALVNNAVGPVSTITRFDQHSFTLKGDHILNDRHKLSGSLSYIARPRLFFDQSSRNTLFDTSDMEYGGPLSSADTQRVRHHLARLSWDWTATSRMVNNMTIHYNRMINPMYAVQGSTNGAKELGIKNLNTYGYPYIVWGNGPIIGLSNIGDPQESFQASMGYGLADTWSLSKGRHFIKAGIDVRYNPVNARPGAGGTITFAARSTSIPNASFSGSTTGYSFASYLLGIVDNASYSDPFGKATQRNYYAWFINDDFKVSDRLTLNLGLRWDYQPTYTERFDRMANWTTSVTDPKSGLPGAYEFAGSCPNCTGKRYFGVHDYKGFGPRLGFAWRAASDWTVRGAYGIFIQGEVGAEGSTAFAWTGTYNLTADPLTPWKGRFNWDDGFPTDAYIAPTFDVSRGNTTSPSMVDPNYGKNTYVQSWNLNIQRQLPKRVILDVGYVGNKSTRLRISGLTRINQLPTSALTQYGSKLNNPVTNAAQAAANGVAYPYAGFSGTVASSLRQYPQVYGNNTISPIGAPEGFATYNSLQIVANKQFSKGLTLYANYVWSKTMTNSDSTMVDYYNRSLEKTVASWDYPHVFKAYAAYDLPFGRGAAVWSTAPRVIHEIISGWAISAILNYSSGAPLSFSGASSPYPTGWNGGQRVNVAAGNLKASGFDKSNFNYANTKASSNTYLNTSLVTDPPAFTIGNSAPYYSQIRGFGTINEDMGILKNFKVAEKYRFQLRGEFLNVFNRHTLGGINTSITSPLFGQVTTASGNRTIQVGARVDF